MMPGNLKRGRASYLQEDVTVRGHPEGPRLVVRPQVHLASKILKQVYMFPVIQKKTEFS